MRKATVVAEQSLSVHAEVGSENVIGYLMRGERVTVIGSPVKRRRQWWQIITERQYGQGSPNVTGWVADGDGTAKWLAVDPLPPMPQRPPDFEPIELPVGALPPWWALLAVIAAVAAVSWALSSLAP